MEKKNLLFTMAFAAMCASASAYAPAASMSAKAPSAFSGKAKVKPEEVKNDRIAHWELAGEVAPNANELNGKLLVIGSSDGASVIAGCNDKRPEGYGTQDLFTVKVADFDADYNTYAKFTKVTDAGVEGDNLYTINICNEKGEIYNVWGWGGFLNFQPEGNIIFNLGLNNQYGQDGKNCGLWQVDAVNGGYTVKNVGNSKYLNPASSNPSVDAVTVKLFEKVNYKTYEAYATDIEDGEKYLLKNVETGKFLAPGNSWSTQASLADHGTFFTIDRLENGKYTLSSVVSNGGNLHYLDGSYCDAAAAEFMIFSTEDGYVLTLNDQVEEPTYFGANANGKTCDFASKERNAATTWQLVTVADLMAATESADEASPADMTFMIKDANFSRNNVEKSAWQTKSYDGKAETANKNLGGGANENFVAESWRSSNGFDIYQDIEGLPAGRYELRAQAAMNNYDNLTEGLPVVYANDETSVFNNIEKGENSMTAMSGSFSAGMYQIKPIQVVVTDGKLRVGVKSPLTAIWAIWDNFELYYLGAEDPMDIDEEIKCTKDVVVEDGNAELVVEFETEAAVTGKAKDIIVFGSAFLQDNGAEIPTTDGYVRDAKGMNTGNMISSNIAQMNSFSIPVPVSGEGKFTAVLPRGFFVYLDADYDWTGTPGVHNIKAKDAARAMAKAAAKGKAGLVQEITVSFSVGANGATSIEGIQGTTANGKVFDLSGRATVTGKGIVIKNGKKVLK